MVASHREDPRSARPEGRGEGAGRARWSVGRVARETGISPAALRAWERRYGNPRPLRLASGHRRYTDLHLAHLRQVSEGLALGLPPRVLLALEPEALARRLSALALRGVSRERPWLAPVRALDRPALAAWLATLDAGSRARTLDRLVGPFLVGLGRAWAAGEIGVRHGHLAAATVAEHLRGERAALAAARGPLRARLLLACLEREEHVLPLEMLALVAEEAGVEPVWLGARTPRDELAAAARELRCELVAVSVSLATGGPGTDRALAELSRALPARTTLLAGGAGLRRARPRGVVRLADLDAFAAWLAEHLRRGTARAGRAGTSR